MKQSRPTTTLRRSVALPSALLRELNSVAPPELRANLNRLVIVSLQEYISRRRQQEFESAIAAMAEDPQVRAECAAIAADFAATEMDGLVDD
jgi:metal-responsive CopG/Arc/MetJ family transcriptional regulator